MVASIPRLSTFLIAVYKLSMVRSQHVRTCFSKNLWARKKDIFKSKYDTMTPFLTQKGVYLCLVPDLVMRESLADYINWW